MLLTKDNRDMETRDAGTESLVDDAAGSARVAAETVNKAVRDTAQKYLSAVGINLSLQDVEERIRGRALFSFGIAAAIGFVLGGGLATRPGVMMVGLFGRTAARRAAMNAGRQVSQAAGSFA
jgi:hypothetical protein